MAARLARPLLVLMSLATAGAASAEGYSDPESGLGVTAPSGYEVNAMPARGKNGVVVSVKRASDRDTGCQVGFAEAPANNKYSQKDINAQMETREHQELARATIGVLYETKKIETFKSGEVTGLVITADIKPREGIPPRAQEISNLMILLETPKGRTSVVCVGEKSDFAKRRPEFEQIARGATLPR